MKNFIPQHIYELIFSRVPRLCVDMVLRDEEGGILLSCRTIEPYKGLWHLPGGGVKFKETLAAAADRIAQEEIGVRVKIVKTLGFCETLNDDLDEKTPRHSVSVVVEVEPLSGAPRQTNGLGSGRIEYFNKLPTDIHPYHRSFLESHTLLMP